MIVKTRSGQPVNKCNWCGYTWAPRKKGSSPVCPLCNTTLWNKTESGRYKTRFENLNIKMRGQRVIKIKKYTCLKCSHEWTPRTEEKPKTCPKCKSAKWEKGE